MQIPNQAWVSQKQSRGILFFAQLMHQLLYDYSWDSYRAHALVTPSRLKEAIIVAQDIQENRIPKIALTPVLEELSWSLNSDPMAKALLGERVDILLRIISNQQSEIRSIIQTLQYAYENIYRDYQQACESRILELCIEERRRIELKKVTLAYCSHLINRGFSRKFIFDHVRDTFYSEGYRRMGRVTLGKFFSEFSDRSIRYTVYSKTNSKFANILQE
jgi:hypothetical protein